MHSVRLLVRLTPRDGANRVEGTGLGGELRVRVRAAPVEGAANEALVRLLARELGVGRSAVVLERGKSARLKRIRVEGVDPESLRQRWPDLALDEDRR